MNEDILNNMQSFFESATQFKVFAEQTKALFDSLCDVGFTREEALKLMLGLLKGDN